MECSSSKKLTNEMQMMIRQGAISVKVEETDAAVTNFPGVVALAKLGERLGLFADLEGLLPGKERSRGFSNSAAVFDLMCLPLSGAECIDELGVVIHDDFRNGNAWPGIEALAFLQQTLGNCPRR